MSWALALVGFLAALAVGSSATAEQNDPRLNELFTKLRNAQAMPDR